MRRIKYLRPKSKDDRKQCQLAAKSERDEFSKQRPTYFAAFIAREHGHISLANVGLGVYKYILIR